MRTAQDVLLGESIRRCRGRADHRSPRFNREAVSGGAFTELVKAWYFELSEAGYTLLPLRKINITHATRFLGTCTKPRGEYCILAFSEVLLKVYDMEEGNDVVREIILHELCHAIDGVGNGHGAHWKAYAAELSLKYGVTIRRLVAVDYMPLVREAIRSLGKYKYHITCPCGNVDIWKTRKTALSANPKKYRCKKCHEHIIVEDVRGAA